jgi:hypothetical protein
MANLTYAGNVNNPNNSVVSRKNRKNNRKNSRKASRKNNRKNSRKNSRKNNRKASRKNRKQRGGASASDNGIFHSRVAGPIAGVLRVANQLVGDEIKVVRSVVGSAFDGAADAVNALGHGANGVVRSAVRVISRKNRH